MGCSGVLWDVPGVFRRCSGLFQAVPGMFRGVPGVFRGVPGCSGAVLGFTDTQRNVIAIQLAADPIATATNKTVRKQKGLHPGHFDRIFSCTKLTVSSIRD